MAGLLKSLVMTRETGQVPMAVATCHCSWDSGPQSSRTRAVALHKQHVVDECPIGRRRPLPDSFKRSTG